jgi:inosose dehydratase
MNGSWSRRRFMSVVGATTVASGLPRLVRAAVPEEPAPFRIGLQSYTFRSFPLEKMLDTCQSLGIETIEFFSGHYSPESNDEQVAAMNKQLAAHDLKLLSHGVNKFTKDHEANKRSFEFAKRAGIRNITADPSEDSFDSLDKLVAEYDVRIAIHNHGPGARYDKVDSVLRAVKGRHPNIGACADLGHYIRTGEDPVRVINLLEGRLFGVHLKDYDAPRGDAKGTILGKGLMDVPGVLAALKKVNMPSDACMAIEYEENSADPTEDVKACVATVRDAAKKVFG